MATHTSVLKDKKFLIRTRKEDCLINEILGCSFPGSMISRQSVPVADRPIDRICRMPESQHALMLLGHKKQDSPASDSPSSDLIYLSSSVPPVLFCSFVDFFFDILLSACSSEAPSAAAASIVLVVSAKKHSIAVLGDVSFLLYHH